MKKDTALKVILVSIFGLILLWVAKVILFPTNYYGFGINFNGYNGGDHMYMNGNYGYGAGTFTVLLVLLFKVLIFVFVMALLVGLFMAAKNYLFNSRDFSLYKGTVIPVERPKKTCQSCGKTLENGWKVCPYCATEVSESN